MVEAVEAAAGAQVLKAEAEEEVCATVSNDLVPKAEAEVEAVRAAAGQSRSRGRGGLSRLQQIGAQAEAEEAAVNAAAGARVLKAEAEE